MQTLGGHSDGSSPWVPAIPVGDLDGVLGSWHQLGLVPAVTGIWGVSQWMADLSVYFSFK